MSRDPVLNGTRVTVQVMMSGFHSARGRFVQTESDGRMNAYIPLFEALNWVTAIDDRLQHVDWPGERAPKGARWSDEFPEGQLLRGFRFARNCVHHQWTDAVHKPGSGRWRWHLRLPTRERDGRGEYESRLAGREVSDALQVLDDFFIRVATHIMDEKISARAGAWPRRLTD